MSQDFTFTTTGCSLQLTHFNFLCERSLKTTKFTAYGCRFADDFFVRLQHVDYYCTGDIIEKCLLSTFIRVVLSVRKTQLGKNLEDSIGKRLFTGRYSR